MEVDEVAGGPPHGLPPHGSDEREGREGRPERNEGKGIAYSGVARVCALAGGTFLLYLALEHLPFYGGLIGIVGAVVGLFAPAPSIQVFLRWGTRAGIAGLLGVAFALGLAGGWGSSIQFLASIGVIVWMLSVAILSGRSVEVAVGWSVLGAALGLGVLYAAEALGMSDGTVAPGLVPEVNEGVGRLPSGLGGMDGEEFRRLLQVVGRLMPAVAIMQAALISLLNYMVIRYVWTLRGLGAMFPPRELGRWSMPESAVWVLIASGLAMFFLRREPLFSAGGNILLLLSFGYFLHGLAILHFFFRKFDVAIVFRVPLYFVGFTFSYLVALFGLFDLWFDFRKIRTAGPSPEGPAGD
ncbi:MAG: DUF2232 domain-containing protein [Nitrospinota bacterium]